MSYSDLLRDPRWQRKRLEIMQRDDFKCRMCGDAESTLNVHHLRYRRGAMPWDYSAHSLITTCETCHQSLHASAYGECFAEALIAGGMTESNLAALNGHLDVRFTITEFAGRALSESEWNEIIARFAEMIREAQRS